MSLKFWRILVLKDTELTKSCAISAEDSASSASSEVSDSWPRTVFISGTLPLSF